MIFSIFGRVARGVAQSRQKRVAERIPVAHDTILLVRKGLVTYHVRVFDITMYGFMVQAKDSIHPRDLIEIKLPILGWVAAQVRWGLYDGRFGCKFLEAVEPESFSLCLSNLDGAHLVAPKPPPPAVSARL